MIRLRQQFIFLFFFTTLSSCAQPDSLKTEPYVEKFAYTIGNKNVSVSKTTFGAEGKWFIVQLHHDEQTAGAAAIHFLKRHGGTLLQIENGNNRYIRFSLKGRQHTFDPNRMFSTSGIQKNLQLFRCYTADAAKQVSAFGNFLLDFIPDTALVIAIHNNTEGRYSINSYNREMALKKSIAALSISETHDSDDFFITTDRELYSRLSNAGYNALLQRDTIKTDDGSLSIYFGRNRRRYINVEAQAGHLEQQQDMLQAITDAGHY